VQRAAAAALLLLAGSAAAFEPKTSATHVSANGVYAIRLVELGEGRCRLEVVRGQGVAWIYEKCVGGANDLYFISNDGKRFWVLFPLPEEPPAKGRRRSKHSPLLEAVVAVEYDDRGHQIEERRLGAFLSERAVGELRRLGRHFKWLGGVLSVPGTPPRVNETGELVVETVAPKAHKLKF
jgi:hypothetical protein